MTDAQPAPAGDGIDALLQRALALHRQNRPAEATALYLDILRRDPRHFDALHMSGVAALQTRHLSHGIALIQQAIAINPNVAEAHNHLGNGLREQYRHAEALACFDRAIALRPHEAAFHRNRALALQNLGRHAEALAGLEEAMALQPDLAFLPGLTLQARMTICDWRGVPAALADLRARLERGEPAAMPFAAVTLLGAPALERRAAELYAARHTQPDTTLPALTPYPPHERLRIGYFSADLHDHATAYLMAEVFERHDRTAFEITAFSFGKGDSGPMRARLRTAFDRFIDVRADADRDVALLARSLEIDIAVDLKGYTKDFRAGIFAARAAPIQVNYLGYPGTMGAPGFDYIIADPLLIADQEQALYSEKIVWLPDSYQPNDSTRPIAGDTPSRTEAGLPPQGFVFCCFNNSHKITPPVFDTWMRILQEVEQSLLWLLHDNDAAVANLRAAAVARGVAAERLVFAPRLPLPAHLARHRLADLFLDTLPYNAHTTASDALWAGLPVLTCVGESFAGRVAASLLNAAGLPELITARADDYAARALALARDPAALGALRDTLACHRRTAPLFDTARFTAHLEAAYQAMQARHRAGLPPAPIRVPPRRPPRSPEQLQALFARGVALHQQGDTDAAARLYEEVLRQAPRHFDALHLRGVAALQARATREGVAWIRKAVAIDPSVAAAFRNLGHGLRELGHHDEAQACFDRASALQESGVPAPLPVPGRGQGPDDR